jgi:hypothetical protein
MRHSMRSCIFAFILATGFAWGQGPKEIVFVQTSEGLNTKDGAPMIGEKFVFDSATGKQQLGGGLTTDLRNTILDFTNVPESNRVLTFARVVPQKGNEYFVALHSEKTKKVFIDASHTFFPNDLRKIAQQGPFIELKFKPSREASALVGGVLEVRNEKGSVTSTTIGIEGNAAITIPVIKDEILRLRFTFPKSQEFSEKTISVPIVGATRGLISYLFFDWPEPK